jgi:hypothetical protein
MNGRIIEWFGCLNIILVYAIIDLDEVTSFKFEREQALMVGYCYELIELHTVYPL